MEVAAWAVVRGRRSMVNLTRIPSRRVWRCIAELDAYAQRRWLVVDGLVEGVGDWDNEYRNAISDHNFRSST